MEYLGFWVIRDVVKHIDKKVEAMKNMTPLTSQKEVLQFISLIQ